MINTPGASNGFELRTADVRGQRQGGAWVGVPADPDRDWVLGADGGWPSLEAQAVRIAAAIRRSDGSALGIRALAVAASDRPLDVMQGLPDVGADPELRSAYGQRASHQTADNGLGGYPSASTINWSPGA